MPTCIQMYILCHSHVGISEILTSVAWSLSKATADVPLTSADWHTWMLVFLALSTELSISDLQKVNHFLFRWRFWWFAFTSAFESHGVKEAANQASVHFEWQTRGRVWLSVSVLKSHFALQCFQLSTPSCTAPYTPYCLLNQMVRPNECPMISNEAFNMNSILMTVMMLILWTGKDEPIWKCALLSAVFFPLSEQFYSVLQHYSICHLTNLSLTWQFQ